jgi:integrase
MLDFERGIITVPAEISKNKRTMSVIMFDTLKEILLAYIGSDTLPDDFFLLSKTGKPSKTPISSSYVARTHAQIMQANNFDTRKFKPYSWKHTGNAIAYKNGASLRFLKMQNRHRNEATTEIYLKSIVPEHLATFQAQYFDF